MNKTKQNKTKQKNLFHDPQYNLEEYQGGLDAL
jgi:hypothetical protein